jgi:hypothetical protein
MDADLMIAMAAENFLFFAFKMHLLNEVDLAGSAPLNAATVSPARLVILCKMCSLRRKYCCMSCRVVA